MPAATSTPMPNGVSVIGPMTAGYSDIINPESLAFLASLARNFEGRRQTLLARRVERQKDLSAGANPDFLAETRAVREGDWRVAPIPPGLENRRVEITGPVDRK